MKRNKRGIESEMAGYASIAVIILIILIGGTIILSGKGTWVLEQIKNFFRFGGG